MRVTPMHRIRVGSLRISPSTNFASSKPRYLLGVLQAVLIFVTSALLSQASLFPSTLVSVTTPTWHSVSLPLGQGLDAANSQGARAIVTITCSSSTTCLGGGEGADGAVLLRSTSGGATWHPVSLPRGQGLYGRIELDRRIWTITCSSSTTCLGGGEGADGAVLLRSTSGGATWHSVSLPRGQGLYNGSGGLIVTITCSSSTTCLAGGDGTNGAVLLRSSDAGATWHPVSLPRGQGFYGHNGSGGGIFTITCSSSTACLAGGRGTNGAVLLSSTSGGATWHPVSLPRGQGLYGHIWGSIWTITCPSSTACLAGGRGTNGAVLLRSSDAGATWHPVSLPRGQGFYGHNGSGGGIFTNTCPSSTTCFAGGYGTNGAVLLSSTSGGATWHPVSLPRGQGFYGHNGSGGAILTNTCPSSTTCFAGGYGTNGAVLLSAPNPVSSTLTSKLPVIGEVVVLLVILVIIALALQRRRAKRAPALAGVGTANNSAPPTQSAPPTPGSDSSLTHNDSGAGWLNCRSCGGQNPRDNRFCSHCGNALDG